MDASAQTWPEFVARNRAVEIGDMPVTMLAEGQLVLLIEDNDMLVSTYVDMLGPVASHVLWAQGNQAARVLFNLSKDRLAAISFDYSVCDGDTLALIREIKPRFKGPMLACSSEPRCREAQMDAGCTINVPKQQVPGVILDILGQTQGGTLRD